MKLRRALPNAEDFHAIAELMKCFANEFEMGKLSSRNFDPVKCAGWVAQNLECATWVLEDGENGVVGSIGLHKMTPWYSDDPYLADGWLYVKPEFRHSRSGAVLVAAAMSYAEEVGLPLVINVYSQDAPEAKIKALTRMGLKFVGGTFIVGE